MRHAQSGSVINRQSAELTAMVKESPLDPPPMSVNTRSQYVWVTTGFRVTLPFGSAVGHVSQYLRVAGYSLASGWVTRVSIGCVLSWQDWLSWEEVSGCVT